MTGNEVYVLVSEFVEFSSLSASGNINHRPVAFELMHSQTRLLFPWPKFLEFVAPFKTPWSCITENTLPLLLPLPVTGHQSEQSRWLVCVCCKSKAPRVELTLIPTGHRDWNVSIKFQDNVWVNSEATFCWNHLQQVALIWPKCWISIH